jgi:hypothetical protein
MRKKDENINLYESFIEAYGGPRKLCVDCNRLTYVNSGDGHCPICNGHEWVFNRYSPRTKKLKELRAKNHLLVDFVRHVAKEGPLERYGSNIPARLIEWVLAVRSEAMTLLGGKEEKSPELS